MIDKKPYKINIIEKTIEKHKLFYNLKTAERNKSSIFILPMLGGNRHLFLYKYTLIWLLNIWFNILVHFHFFHNLIQIILLFILIWNRRIFNLPDYVLNRSEINRLTVIGTQEVKLLYPPASGRQRPSVSLDRYIPESGRGKLLAQESENGLTLNEALTRLISSPEYQALPRTALGNNRSERSDRWWEIIDVYKEFAKDKFNQITWRYLFYGKMFW